MEGQDQVTGRFLPGNKLGKGHPKKSREERYWAITMRACSFKDWQAIMGKAVEQAKEGDRYARAWLADRLLGRPVQRTESLIEVKDIDTKYRDALDLVYENGEDGS